MKKLDKNEMATLLALTNRAIDSGQLIIPSTIEDNIIQCTDPQYAVMLQPFVQIIDKGFMHKCLIDQMCKGEDSIGGAMLSLLAERPRQDEQSQTR